MFQDKVRLKDTIKIVGDPCAQESEWLPVCIAHGEKQLVRLKPAPAKPSHRFLGNFLCSSSILSASLGHYLLAIFTAGFLFTCMTGFGTNWYMEQFKLEQYLAVPVLFFGGIGFWQQFISAGSKLAYHVTAGLLFALTAACCFAPVAFSLMILAALSHSFMSFIGLEVRRALPTSFNVGGALKAHGISCFMLGGFILMTACMSIHSSTTTGLYQAQPYMDTSAAMMIMMQAFLALGVAVPSAAVAFMSKSRCASSCAWLSVLMQTPILAALSLVLALSGTATVLAGIDLSLMTQILAYFNMPAFSSDMIYTGGALCLSSLAAISSVALWAALGAKIGVVMNKSLGRGLELS